MTIRMYLIVRRHKRWIPFDETLFYKIIEGANLLIEAEAFNVNERIVPKRTGNLQESFGIQKEEGGRILRFYWTAPYAQFVDEGFPPSPGRYVPAIDRRLVRPSRANPDIGTHPGYEGAHFSEVFAAIIKEVARQALYDTLTWWYSHE